MRFLLAFVDGSTISQVAFAVVCLFVLFALVAASGLASHGNAKRSMVGMSLFLTVYCAMIAGMAGLGFVERVFIPFGPLFLAMPILLAMAFGLTKFGRKISMAIPLSYLIAFQGFRFPLELILHDWHSSGTIPQTMTWTGSNWDIVTGVFAMVSCALVERRRWLAWLFNILGILLLANVIRVAVLSSPVPFGWNVEPPLELILHLPYAFIVPICVGGAALGHVLLTRRLMSRI
jgi:hypothetical protein